MFRQAHAGKGFGEPPPRSASRQPPRWNRLGGARGCRVDNARESSDGLRYQRRIATLRSEGLGGSLPEPFDRSLVRLRPFRDYLDDGLGMIGSPDEVLDRLQEYLEATGYQHVLLLMALPGLATAKALRSMRLFAEEVGPAVKSVAQRA